MHALEHNHVDCTIVPAYAVGPGNGLQPTRVILWCTAVGLRTAYVSLQSRPKRSRDLCSVRSYSCCAAFALWAQVVVVSLSG